MVQSTFVAATSAAVFTGRTSVFTGSSVANAASWYVYNERND